jgi:membrane-associated phospholipid phosphatase
MPASQPLQPTAPRFRLRSRTRSALAGSSGSLKRELVGAALAVALVTLSSHALAEDPTRVEWSPDWRHFQLWEGLDVIAFGAGSLLISIEASPQSTPHWTGGILFDNWARNALRGHTESTQATAAHITDDLYLGSIVAPFLADVWVVAFGIDQAAEVGTEMALIDAQSLGVAGLLSITAEKTVGRARPFVADCGSDGIVRDGSGNPLYNQCQHGGEDYQSFFSGHAAVTAAMAGVTCVHHQHLPLYGGGWADLTPCLVMVGVSLGTGIGRVVADKHWASDVITGWSLGFLSGYVLPSLLHYGFGRGPHAVGEFKVAGARMVPVPSVYAGGAGMGLVGTF